MKNRVAVNKPQSAKTQKNENTYVEDAARILCASASFPQQRAPDLVSGSLEVELSEGEYAALAERAAKNWRPVAEQADEEIRRALSDVQLSSKEYEAVTECVRKTEDEPRSIRITLPFYPVHAMKLAKLGATSKRGGAAEAAKAILGLPRTSNKLSALHTQPHGGESL